MFSIRKTQEIFQQTVNDIAIVELAETDAYHRLVKTVVKPIELPKKEHDFTIMNNCNFPRPGEQLFFAGFGSGPKNDPKQGILRGRRSSTLDVYFSIL